MLLAKGRRRNPNVVMAVGQGSLAIAVILTMIARYLESAAMPHGFTLGFLSGLSGTLFGLSIVMNIQLIRLTRASK